MTPTRDQFAGCLLGQCLGDALGFPVEGRPPEWCELHVEQLRKGSLRGRGKFPFGQYTDDSQLARELLESWVVQGAFDPADFGRRVAAIFSEERIVGRGRATEQAARRLAEGVPWDEAGTPSPAAGNGSSMRAGPVGLMTFADPDRLVQVAVDQGRVTHQDPRCSAGAVAISGGVALALEPGPVDSDRFISRLQPWVAKVDADFAEGLERLKTVWLALPPEEAVQPISTLGVDPNYGGRWQGISPFVVGSVLWSLYSFLRHPDDYLGAVYTAIAVGGDVDTTAAMTGAIAGARAGLAALPQPVRRVHDRETWGHDELVDLAHRAWELVCSDTSPEAGE